VEQTKPPLPPVAKRERTFPPTYDMALSLYQSKKYEDALACIEDAMNEDAKAAAPWSMRRTGPDELVRFGRRVFYVIGTKGIEAGDAKVLWASAKDDGSATLCSVRCYSGSTGELKWQMRVMCHPSTNRFKVDLDSDDSLIIVDKRIVCLSLDGKVLNDDDIPSEPLLALVQGNRFVQVLDLKPSSRPVMRTGLVYDMAQHKAESRDVPTQEQLAPNALATLVQGEDATTDTLSCMSLKEPGRVYWTYKRQGLHFVAMQWERTRVIAVGWVYAGGIAACIDGMTGQVIWEKPLDLKPARATISDGGVAMVGWGGFISVLTIADGQQIAKGKIPSDSIIPAMVDGALVEVSDSEIKGTPLNVLTKRSELDMSILQIRILRDMGSHGDAFVLAQRLSAKYPKSGEALELVASEAAASNKPGAALRAGLRLLDVSKKSESPLLEPFAIRHYVDTGPMVAAPVLTDAVGHFASLDAQAYSINLATGETRKTSVRADGIRYLLVIGEFVYSAGNREEYANPIALVRNPRSVRLDGFGSARTPSPDRAFPVMSSQATPPEEFFNLEDDGQIVNYQQKYFRPARGGAVRVYDGTAVKVTNAGTLPLRGRWRICTAADRPLGYDNEGVYELDPDTLVPRSKLLAPPESAVIDAGRPCLGALASDQKTLCRITINKGRKDATVRVYSLDGKTVLREETVASHESLSSEQVMPMWGGYMVFADEMAWIPSDKDGKVWRMKMDMPPEEEAAAPPPAGRNPIAVPSDVCTFVGAVMYQDKMLYVGRSEGGIFGFDMEKLKKLAGQ
jgi:hypothetical protein